MNIKAVMNTIQAIVKIRPEKKIQASMRYNVYKALGSVVKYWSCPQTESTKALSFQKER